MRDVYIDETLRERWDETARTVTTWTATGALIGTRPYTAQESAAMDARTLAETAAANEATIRDRAAAALTANTTFLAIANPTNAQVVAHAKVLTREATALIRLALRLLDSASGT